MKMATTMVAIFFEGKRVRRKDVIDGSASLNAIDG